MKGKRPTPEEIKEMYWTNVKKSHKRNKRFFGWIFIVLIAISLACVLCSCEKPGFQLEVEYSWNDSTTVHSETIHTLTEREAHIEARSRADMLKEGLNLDSNPDCYQLFHEDYSYPISCRPW